MWSRFWRPRGVQEGKGSNGREGTTRGVSATIPPPSAVPLTPPPNLPFRPLIYCTGFCRVAILFCFGHNVDHAACKEEGAELVHRSGRCRRLDLLHEANSNSLHEQIVCGGPSNWLAGSDFRRNPVELVSWIGFPKKPSGHSYVLSMEASVVFPGTNTGTYRHRNKWDGNVCMVG